MTKATGYAVAYLGLNLVDYLIDGKVTDAQMLRWAVLLGFYGTIRGLEDITKRLPEPPPIPAKPRWAPFDRVDSEFIGAAIAGILILGIVLWAIAVKG
jgi:hypothetical protein